MKRPILASFLIASAAATQPAPSPPVVPVTPVALEKIVEAETPDRETLAAGVFDRLLALLEEIPQRWDSLPPPRLPYSGKGPREVLAESSEEQNQAALRFISRLALAPLEARPELIRRWLEEHPPTEVDVWLPMQLAEAERLKSRQESALTLEAWLQWAEALGRKDALLWAAGDALYDLSIRHSFRILEGIGEMWTNLAAVPEASCAQAHLRWRYADVLGLLDRYQEALPYYTRARDQCAADPIERGRTWLGEGQARQKTNDNDGGLQARRHARDLFEAVGDQLGIGYSWLGEGHILLLKGDHVGALRALRKARDIFEATGDPRGQAKTWLLQSYLDDGDHDSVLRDLHQAHDLFAQVGDAAGEAEALIAQAYPLLHRGDTEGALQAFRQARTLFEAFGSPSGQASTWTGEGNVLSRLGDIDRALRAFRQARQLYESFEDQIGQADTWFGEAGLLHVKGDKPGALHAFRKARALYEAAEFSPGQATSWFGEAGILHLLGDDYGALRACRQAHLLAEAAGDQHFQKTTWFFEALVLSSVSDNEGALRAYRQLRTLAETDGNQRGQGEAWLGEAGILLQQGDAGGALQAYRRARAHFEAVREDLGRGNTWYGEAEALSRLGNHDGALQAYRRARALFEGHKYWPLESGAWQGEARSLLALGYPDQAAEAADRAVDLATPAGDKLGAGFALLIGAEAHRRLERFDQVIERAAKALRLLDEWRRGYVTDAQRVRFQNGIRPAYELLISTLWEMEKPFQALERAEQARARVLLDLLTIGYAHREREGNFDLSEARLRLEIELAEIERRLRQPISPEEREELAQQRREADQELERLHFESLFTAEVPLASEKPLDLEGIRGVARQVGPILLYYVAEEQSFAFLIRPELDEPVARRLELPRARLRQQAGGLADALANPNYEARAEALARELWRELLGPFAEHLPEAGPLTLVPHGPLHQIPFEALIDAEGRRLFERFDIAVAPSISTLEHLRTLHQPASADDRFLALAGGAGLTLPATEIRAIASLFDPKQAAEFEPGLTSFRTYEKLAPHTRHLLIATQALLTDGDRRQTYLEIEPSNDHDSRLTAAEIATLPIDAELVTLAACDTAGGEALLSDERLDLSRAFLIAGAAAVLATRWKVPEDFRTSRFLLDFYREYRQGGPEGQGLRKDQALNAARRLSRERGDPARIWAAWVLIGDAR